MARPARGAWFEWGFVGFFLAVMGIGLALAVHSCSHAFDGLRFSLDGFFAHCGFGEPGALLPVPGEVEMEIPEPGVSAVMFFREDAGPPAPALGPDGRIDARPPPDVEWTIEPPVAEAPAPTPEEEGWLAHMLLHVRVRIPAAGRYVLRARGPPGALLLVRETRP